MDFQELAKFASQAISLAIVAGSFGLKLPQIIGIVRNGNANGVSLLGNLIEGVGFVVTASWGYVLDLPFRQYGEGVIILVQLAVLILMIGYMNGGAQLSIAAVGLAALGAIGYALCMGLVPQTVHEALMGIQIVFTIFSRVPQIIMNQKNKFTGALSFTTFFLAFGGAAARGLTTLISVPMEKGKLPMFTNSLIGAALNAIIVLQIYVYGQKKSAKDVEEKNKAEKKAESKKTK